MPDETVTLRRGVANLPAMRGALDQLGIETGDDFVISRAPDGDAAAKNKLGGFKSETGRQAALDNYPRSGSQRWQVLQAVAGRGPITSVEIAREEGMHLPSVKPRLTELRQGGFVEKRGTKPGPKGSKVDAYVLTPRGRDEINVRGDG